MIEENEVLNKNKTCSLIPRPKGAKIVENKWVYRIKTDSQGEVSRYKARLVAK